jgi:hypothetical protein
MTNPLRKRVLQMALIWAFLGQWVGAEIGMRAGGLVGSIADCVAVMVEMAILGAVLGSIGGSPRDTLIGAVVGLIAGQPGGSGRRAAARGMKRPWARHGVGCAPLCSGTFPLRLRTSMSVSNDAPDPDCKMPAIEHTRW